MNADILFECKRLFVIMLGGFLAYLLLFTSLTDHFFVWLVYRLLYVADTMFHELGHTVFYWAFGMPAIPSIFTLFGSDQAGGATLAFPRTWLMQYISFGTLACLCYWVRCNYPALLWPAIAITLAITGVAFTRYYEVIELYMGHGGSIFMGGYFLFRAWEYVHSRKEYTRFMNALFGFFLVFDNMHLAYRLKTDGVFRENYATPTFGGAIDNDFVQIADIVWHWSLQGIASFTFFIAQLRLSRLFFWPIISKKMIHYNRHYTLAVIFLILTSCVTKSAGDVDWNNMNYAEDCGETSDGSFKVSSPCKMKDTDMNVATMGGHHSGGHR